MGGKEKLQWIIRPVFPHQMGRYAEHFGGSGAILLGQPRELGRLEVYNDYDQNLTNLFLCVRDRPLALTRELGFLPLHSEAEFKALKRLLDRGMPIPDFTGAELEAAEACLTEEQYAQAREILTGRAELWDVRRAAAFYRVIRYSFSATTNSFGVHQVRLQGFLNLMQKAAARLDGVVITNRDCCASIALNDGPDTLHYCDPPYYKAEDKYRLLFTEKDHRRLHAALAECVGHVVVSYNYCDFVRDLYQDFYILRFERQNGMAQRKGAKYEEAVITNYDPRPMLDGYYQQLDMFQPWAADQEQGELRLIHAPGTPTKLEKTRLSPTR